MAALVTLAVLTVLAVLTASLVLRDRGPRAVAPAPPPGSPVLDQRAATDALLADLARTLRRGDPRTARRLAPSEASAGLSPPRVAAAQRLAASLVDNASRLRVTDLAVRAVTRAPATADLRRRFGAGTWVARVAVSWRYAGVDRRSVSSVAELVLVPGRDGAAALVGTRAVAGEQGPSWLFEPLTVRRRGNVVVAASDAVTASRLLVLASRAVRVVQRRFPAWRGDLVVEAPGGSAALRAAAGLSPAAARTLAAVTTTADGSSLPGSPPRVFVNGRVFDLLGATSQRIVLSHEATHVAVGAPLSALPVWLSEGFADHVALAGSRVPVAVLSTQVRALVRRQGVPPRLPGRAQFDPAAPGVGAAYESSWLAVRLLAATYGEAALLRFLRVAERRGRVEPAFRSVLGTSEAAFTRLWRRELAELAG